ncbi:MAG: hypothetical protein KKF06_04840 [Candidatus Margulisbacteria bacterium]|nr:hypothetical protein [Candidatus Margulisiibacteriota bacterium]
MDKCHDHNEMVLTEFFNMMRSYGDEWVDYVIVEKDWKNKGNNVEDLKKIIPILEGRNKIKLSENVIVKIDPQTNKEAWSESDFRIRINEDLK